MLRAMESCINRFQANPSLFSTRVYSAAEKEMVLSYMKSLEFCAVAGKVYDCVKGKELGLTNVGYDDGKYIWSLQDTYHVENYDAAVTDAFIDHIKKTIKAN